MIPGLEQGLGAVLVFLVLLDVFLTILYARMGTSLFGSTVERAIWTFFVAASKVVDPSRRGTLLSFGGPVIVVLLLAVWVLGLTLGAALIMHPELGTAIRVSNGETPTDFIAALYAGGSSMAIVGASDFAPHTSATRLLFLFDSFVGVTVTSLTLTYLMQVYTALQRRNVLAMNLHFLSGCTGDAAELLARIAPRGEFSAAYTNLSTLAVEMTAAKEAHHFYPVLFYFRFSDPHHSVSRSALVALDAVSLIRSVLDERQDRWVVESGAVTQLWEASLLLVTSLERTFLSRGARASSVEPDERTRARWRARYRVARERLQQAGIQTMADARAGAEAYVASRMQWHHHIANLAPTMAYRMDEIDPATRGAGFRTTSDDRPGS